MFSQLPQQVQPHILAQDNSRIQGTLSLASFERLIDYVGNQQVADVVVDLQFSLDDQNRPRISGTLESKVSADCQRCLEPFTLAVDCSIALTIMSDEQAKEGVDTDGEWNGDIEPLIIQEKSLSLAQLVEDELILSLPVIIRHHEQDCGASRSVTARAVVDGKQVEIDQNEREEDNPFAALAVLKSECDD